MKLPQLNFFLPKQLIKLSCNYWTLSFCKTLKKFLGLIESYEDVFFWTENGPFVNNKFFLVQTSIITFIYLLAYLCSKSRVIRMHHFWTQNGSFASNKFFFWKSLLILSWSSFSPFSFCKIFKKIIEPIQSYEDVPFSHRKYPSLSWAKVFGTNHYYYFHLPIGLFH